MRRLQVYASDSLRERLHVRAEEAGTSVSSLACVLLDQGLRDPSPIVVESRSRPRGRTGLDWLKDRQVAAR